MPNATCDFCKTPMAKGPGATCRKNDLVTYPDGELVPSIPYMGEEPCHDCNVSPGGNHHPGCDMERCPRCQGQLISCGCLDTQEYEEDG